jgi:DNA-binding response OmpR family regulator
MTAQLETLGWRRTGCDDRCWLGHVLVVGERSTRTIEAHDADAHEDYIREALGVPRVYHTHGSVRIGPLTVNLQTRAVSVLTMPVEDLTRREWQTLSYLVSNAGRVLPFAEILDAVWGADHLGKNDAVLRSSIRGLRQKLWEAAPLIENVRGQGYRMRLELPAEETT